MKYLADELAKRGHEIHIFHSLDAFNIKRKSMPEYTKTDGVYTHPIKTHFNYSSYATYLTGNSSKTTDQFKEIVTEIKPAVVHHHNISLLGYDLLNKQGNYQNLYTAHDYWLICQQNNMLKNGAGICKTPSCFSCALHQKRIPQFWRSYSSFRAALSDIDTVIVPSAYLLQSLSKKLQNEIVEIPNFVPQQLTTYNYSEFSGFFLFAGVLERHKGVLDLINLYKEEGNQIQQKLVIVGAGTLERSLRSFIKVNGLENKIILLGRVDDTRLHQLLSDADALLVPSIWPENCPLIALEALSLATPVIASNKGGLPEIVGKLNQKLIYNSLEDLLAILKEFDKQAYSSSIKAIYNENYSPDAFFRRYSAVLHRIN